MISNWLSECSVSNQAECKNGKSSGKPVDEVCYACVQLHGMSLPLTLRGAIIKKGALLQTMSVGATSIAAMGSEWIRGYETDRIRPVRPSSRP
jgi:hypothetical protein